MFREGKIINMIHKYLKSNSRAPSWIEISELQFIFERKTSGIEGKPVSEKKSNIMEFENLIWHIRLMPCKTLSLNSFYRMYDLILLFFSLFPLFFMCKSHGLFLLWV